MRSREMLMQDYQVIIRLKNLNKPIRKIDKALGVAKTTINVQVNNLRCFHECKYFYNQVQTNGYIQKQEGKI